MKDLEQTAAFNFGYKYFTIKEAERKLTTIQEMFKKKKRTPNFYEQNYIDALKKDIEKARKEIILAKNKEVIPETYPMPIYTSDYYVEANALITNPAYQSTEFGKVSDMHIAQVKYGLSHTNTKGKILIQAEKKIGPEKVQKLLTLVSAYNEQVKRQAQYLQVSPYEKDVFYADNFEKELIVKKEYMAILDYLLENVEEEYVWGVASDRQKDLLYKSRRKNKTYWKLARIIRDYTTLPELEQGITKSDTLKRFIVK